MPAGGQLECTVSVSYFKNAVLPWFQNFSTKNKINSMENGLFLFYDESGIICDSKEVLVGLVSCGCLPG